MAHLQYPAGNRSLGGGLLRGWRRIVALIGALVFVLGCGRKEPVVLEPLRSMDKRTPIVFIPGITGSKLRDLETGKLAWGNLSRLFSPRDGGYSSALPIVPETEPPNFKPEGLVERIRIPGLVSVDIYYSLIRALEANGYVVGDLASPTEEATLLLFAYDWRQENVNAATELAAGLERLRQVRGEGELRVDFICQSNAARIARYFIKYGGATIEQAEAGEARPPQGIRVEKLILVATANGGALKTLKEFNRGRVYFPVLGRKIRPETMFSYEALFESLPAYRGDLFFDENGSTVEADLFHAADWERYGWGTFGKKTRKRLAKKNRGDLFGDTQDQLDYLALRLDRARRYHRLLVSDGPEPLVTRYYSVQGLSRPTTERALLVQEKGEWVTYFGWEKRVTRDPLLEGLANVPGDMHATAESQFWLSPREQQAMAQPPIAVDDVHRSLMADPEAQRWVLEFLLDGR